MTSSDLLAIFTAIVVAVIAPTLLSILTGRQARQAKAQDWARQDEVAEKAAQVAAEQLRVQQEALERTELAARTAAQEMLKVKEQLTVIHTLVNNDMTIARQAELNEVRVSAHYLEELMELNRTHTPPVETTTEDIAALKAKHQRIEDLEAIIADREAIMVQVAAEQTMAHEDQAAAAVTATRKP